MTKPFSFIDLFAGIGGFRLGFEAIGGVCVNACEIDDYARRVYYANHGGELVEIIERDIRAVNPDYLHYFDLLCAGFPCQAFSTAGKRKGFDDTRGTLFYEVARILERCRPRALMLENVKGLTTHDDGRTFRVMTRVLEELGYRLSWRVINAAAWVPQKRERIYIIGHLDNPRWNIDFMPVGDPAKGPPLSSILLPDDDPTLDDVTLGDRTWKALQAHRAKHEAAGNGFGYTIADPDGATNTLTARYHKDGSEILIDRPKGNPRRLTPRECARLMGYPDTFKIPVSKSRAYHLFGNSVVPPVIEAVARHIGAP